MKSSYFLYKKNIDNCQNSVENNGYFDNTFYPGIMNNKINYPEIKAKFKRCKEII